MTYREKRDGRIEKMQQKHDAGLISKRFPEVSSIVVDMEHRRSGISAILILRTLHFSSGSDAYFHVECLNRDCKDCAEGFDLDQVVGAMVRSHASSREGELDCDGNGLTSRHVNISYKVTIQYNEN
ncbi:MAG TPA: hypothetical protein VMU21_12020 [Thermodesulfovibrionales bacterium]|nr:hypothetical protein [Thermodesulfovibrionales bacterium]